MTLKMFFLKIRTIITPVQDKTICVTLFDKDPVTGYPRGRSKVSNGLPLVQISIKIRSSLK